MSIKSNIGSALLGTLAFSVGGITLIMGSLNLSKHALNEVKNQNVRFAEDNLRQTVQKVLSNETRCSQSVPQNQSTIYIEELIRTNGTSIIESEKPFKDGDIYIVGMKLEPTEPEKSLFYLYYTKPALGAKQKRTDDDCESGENGNKQGCYYLSCEIDYSNGCQVHLNKCSFPDDNSQSSPPLDCRDKLLSGTRSCFPLQSKFLKNIPRETIEDGNTYLTALSGFERSPDNDDNTIQASVEKLSMECPPGKYPIRTIKHGKIDVECLIMCTGGSTLNKEITPPRCECEVDTIYKQGRCVNCPPGASRPKSATECTCDKSYFVIRDNTCKCPVGQHHYNNRCNPCPQGQHHYNNRCNPCLQGQHYYSGRCNPCPRGQHYYSGACHRCPRGQHYYSGRCNPCPSNKPHYYSAFCHQCPSNKPHYYSAFCHQCPRGQHHYNNTCHQCPPGHNIFYQGRCIRCVVPHVFQNGQCRLCPIGHHYYNSRCNICPQGQHHYLKSGVWCHHCPRDRKYHYNNACHHCPQGQHHYNNACHRCPTGQHYYSGACHRCPRGQHYYFNTCNRCPRNKGHYYNNTCNKCPSSRPHYYNNMCRRCPEKQYLFGNSCSRCPRTAPHYRNGMCCPSAQGDCCMSGYYLDRGHCWKYAPDPNAYERGCPVGKHVVGSINNDWCCPNGYQAAINPKCCPDDYVSSNGACCPRDYYRPHGSNVCCRNGSVFSNGGCCPRGQTFDRTNQRCVR